MAPRKRRRTRSRTSPKGKRISRRSTRRTRRKSGSKRKRTSKRRRRTSAVPLQRTDRKQKGGDVSWDRIEKKWRATILRKKSTGWTPEFIGLFDEETAAKEAYWPKALEILSPIFEKHKLTISPGQPLGSGASAEVWEATDNKEPPPAGGKHPLVAVKVFSQTSSVLNAPFELNALQEMHKGSGAGAEHIIRMIRDFNEDGRTYIVTELVKGKDLFHIVVEARGLDETTAKHLFPKILSGVGHIHGKGWAHCDLKLENVMVGDDGDTVKIIDFGFACDAPKLDLSCSGMRGTPAYRPPQMFPGATYDGKAVDMYTCGVMLYVMLYCDYPKGNKARDDYKQLAYDVPEDVEGVESLRSDPPEGKYTDAWKLIQKLMSYDPVERETAQAALADPWVTSASAAAAEPQPPSPSAPVPSPPLLQLMSGVESEDSEAEMVSATSDDPAERQAREEAAAASARTKFQRTNQVISHRKQQREEAAAASARAKFQRTNQVLAYRKQDREEREKRKAKAEREAQREREAKAQRERQARAQQPDDELYAEERHREKAGNRDWGW